MATADKPACLVLSASGLGGGPGGRQYGCGLFPFLGQLGPPRLRRPLPGGSCSYCLQAPGWNELGVGEQPHVCTVVGFNYFIFGVGIIFSQFKSSIGFLSLSTASAPPGLSPEAATIVRWAGLQTALGSLPPAPGCGGAGVSWVHVPAFLGTPSSACATFPPGPPAVPTGHSLRPPPPHTLLSLFEHSSSFSRPQFKRPPSGNPP